MAVVVDTIMRTKVITASLGDSLHLAIRKMNESGIGSIVVEDDGKPVGIITERDILRLMEHGRNPIPIDLTVDTVMTIPIHTIQRKSTLEEASAILVEKGIRRLPVVFEGKLVGIVTSADIMRAKVELQ